MSFISMMEVRSNSTPLTRTPAGSRSGMLEAIVQDNVNEFVPMLLSERKCSIERTGTMEGSVLGAGQSGSLYPVITDPSFLAVAFKFKKIVLYFIQNCPNSITHQGEMFNNIVHVLIHVAFNSGRD